MTPGLLGSARQIAVIGGNGGIGAALVQALHKDNTDLRLYVSARNANNIDNPYNGDVHLTIDLTDEASIAAAAAQVVGSLDAVIVATGVLQTDQIKPEKSILQLDPSVFAKVMTINTLGPMLIAKHFTPKLSLKGPSVFAALSARVGSIGDNRLGGWYAYRASKAALNMGIRNLSIELQRRRKQAIAVGLHPGTVATALSAPFQKGLPAGQLHSASHAANKLLDVINGLSAKDSGSIFDWRGQRIVN